MKTKNLNGTSGGSSGMPRNPHPPIPLPGEGECVTLKKGSNGFFSHTQKEGEFTPPVVTFHGPNPKMERG